MTLEWLLLSIFGACFVVLWFVIREVYATFKTFQEKQLANEIKIVEITSKLSNSIESNKEYKDMNNEELRQMNKQLEATIEAIQKLTSEIGQMSFNISNLEKVMDSYPKLEQRITELEIKMANKN